MSDMQYGPRRPSYYGAYENTAQSRAALTEEAEALLSAYQALREEVAAFARERFETRFRDL